MDSIVPRYQLPDAWSGKGVCPVCRTAGSLRVAQQSVLPDRMECGVCGAAFEVQSGGTRIRLLVLPKALASRTMDVIDTWLMPDEVPTLGTAGPREQPFAHDLLPPGSASNAARVDSFAADLLPPAPPPGTGPLRRATGSLPARTGNTGSLNASQNTRSATGPLPRGLGTAPLTPSTAAARPGTTPLTPPPAAARPTTAPLISPA
ncbi:MAG: hypothetical protein ABI847_20205, partial [Anaerolineales bacterium]